MSMVVPNVLKTYNHEQSFELLNIVANKECLNSTKNYYFQKKVPFQGLHQANQMAL
jgi:hypothetical protein